MRTFADIKDFPLFLNVGETAQLLGRSPKNVRELLRDDRLPGVKVGGRWVVSRNRLQRQLEGTVG